MLFLLFLVGLKNVEELFIRVGTVRVFRLDLVQILDGVCEVRLLGFQMALVVVEGVEKCGGRVGWRISGTEGFKDL